MTLVSIYLDEATLTFYRRVAQCSGISLEQVLHDALFKLAGELSLQALKNAQSGIIPS